MTEWTRLTPAERKAARDRYQTLQKLPPKKRQEVTGEWERYQQSLAQQQRKQGAPLDPSLTDAAEHRRPAPARAAPSTPELRRAPSERSGLAPVALAAVPARPERPCELRCTGVC